MTRDVSSSLGGRPFWQWLPPPLSHQLAHMRVLASRTHGLCPQEQPSLPRELYFERAALLEFEIGRAGSLVAADLAPTDPRDAIACFAQGPASPSRLLAAHRALLDAGADRRTGPAWLDAPHPADSSYVAPPAQSVPGLVQDLCAFANDARWPVVLRALVVFARMLHVHPFRDGNGRTARAWFQGLLLRELGPRSEAATTLRRLYANGGAPLSLALRAIQREQDWLALLVLAWPDAAPPPD
jgi:hypothetical protein